MRRIIAVLALLLLSATPVLAISYYGNPALMPLFAKTEKGDRFMCTSSIIFPHIGETRALILTAGHCIGASYAKPFDTQMFGGVSHLIRWVTAMKGIMVDSKTGSSSDVAIGAISSFEPFKRRFWLAESSPAVGEQVYIHGYPAGIEQVSIGRVIPNESLASLYPEEAGNILPGSYVIKVKPGSIVGGSSGSPVLNANGNVAGVLWGVILDPTGQPTEWAIVTPVERVHELLKLLGLET